MALPLTGSQTVGPYFAIGMEPLCSTDVPSAGGETFVVDGLLLDGEGRPIPDGMLELWQADAHGLYSRTPATSPGEAAGFARVKTGADGSFRFTTAKPGCVPFDRKQMQAPHILVLVYMRGLLRHLVTRLYFPDEPSNATDPILSLLPPERRSTLMATSGTAARSLHWDIVMRSVPGTPLEETVFFAW